LSWPLHRLRPQGAGPSTRSWRPAQGSRRLRKLRLVWPRRRFSPRSERRAGRRRPSGPAPGPLLRRPPRSKRRSKAGTPRPVVQGESGSNRSFGLFVTLAPAGLRAISGFSLYFGLPPGRGRCLLFVKIRLRLTVPSCQLTNGKERGRFGKQTVMMLSRPPVSEPEPVCHSELVGWGRAVRGWRRGISALATQH